MELLELLYALISLPMLVALLAAILVLQRAWIIPFIRGRVMDKKSVNDGEPPSSHLVAKESDFPEKWWTRKDVWSLEARSVFSNVSKELKVLLCIWVCEF